MKKQYCIQKYVLAESVKEAIKKSIKAPIAEVFIHNSWFEKNHNYNFFQEEKKMGFHANKK